MLLVSSSARRFTYCNCSEREKTRIPGLDCRETVLSLRPDDASAVLGSAMILMTTSYERFCGVDQIALGEEINCVRYGSPGRSRKSKLGNDEIPSIGSDLL
jgi:hypothetical protein